MLINKVKDIKTRKIILIILIMILFGLRLWKLVHFSVLEEDEGRDLLVSRHIIKFGEHLLLGHNMSGINGLFYGPYYYYLLAFVTSLFDNARFIFLSVALLQTIGGYFIYKIGYRLFNYESGIFSLVIYTSSFAMLDATNLYSPYVSLFFFIFSLFYFCEYIKTRKRLLFFGHVFLLIFSVNINSSVIFTLPAFIIWLLVEFFHEKKCLFHKMFSHLLVYFIISVIFLIPQLFYYRERFFNILFNDLEGMGLSLSDYLTNIGNLLNTTNYAIFPRDKIAIVLLFLSLIGLFRAKQYYDKLFIFATSIVTTVLIAAIIGHRVYSIHLLPLYIFIYLFLGAMLSIGFRTLGYLKWVILILISLGLWTNTVLFLTKTYNSLSEVESASVAISKKISPLINNQAFKTDQIYLLENSNIKEFSFFPAPEFWYFVEKITNNKLVTILPEQEFQLKTPEIDYLKSKKNVFLICRQYRLDQNWQVGCKDRFDTDYGDIFKLQNIIYQSNYIDVIQYERIPNPN